MKKTVKILALVMAFVIAIGATAAITTALLQDSDGAVNVMVSGNVYVEQYEQQRDGNGDLEGFVQNKPWLPVSEQTPGTSDLTIGETTYTVYNNANVIDKIVTAKNTGTTSAYLRTLIAVECPAGFDRSLLHLNLNNAQGNGITWNEVGMIDVQGVQYLLLEATYEAPVAGGNTVAPSLLQLYLDYNAGNQDVELYGGDVVVLTMTQAAQAGGFGTAKAALDAAFGETTTTNHPWNGSFVVPAYANDAATLAAALEKGGNVIVTADITVDETLTIPAGVEVTLDLQGNTITGNVPKTVGHVIDNDGTLTVNGGAIESAAPNGGSAIRNDGTLTVNGTTITGAPQQTGGWPSYPVNSYGDITMNDATVTATHGAIFIDAGHTAVINNTDVTVLGWNSSSHVFYGSGDLTINGGTFNHNGDGSLAYMFGDANLTINGCTFTTVGGYGPAILNTADMVITGGTYNSLPLDWTKGNGTITIKGGTFAKQPNAAWIDPTCEVVKNADGTYTVTGQIINTVEELTDFLTAAGAAGSGNTTLDLTCDIDMTGEAWTPVKIDGYNGADKVILKGNGHTIKGLTAPLFAGGFAGGSAITIQDLTIAESNIVSTNTLGSGAFVESVDSMDSITLINCHLLNSTVTGGNGARTGGLIGWTSGYDNQNDGPVKTYITVENCSVVNCTITSNGSVGGIIGHAGSNPWTFHTIKNNSVINCNLNSTDDGQWRVGVVVGTANVGEVTISGTTQTGNTLTQTGKTAPAGQSDLYGRFVPGTTGKLTIDGAATN